MKLARGPRGRALFSECERYRYLLSREWSPGPTLVCCGLNPSTASHVTEDRTMGKVIGFASRWGYGSLVMVNLYAWRATDPRELAKSPDPIGPDNQRVLEVVARHARAVLCAWGQGGRDGRGQEVARMFLRRRTRLICLGLTRNGEPLHPLYQPNSARPILFIPRSE